MNGDTIQYGGASLLKETLEYDFNIEKNFDNSAITKDEFVTHIAKFISNLWQIHVFMEGNARTTAVFLIKYLRKFGYNVTNEVFAQNAWYFRNALVRANYTNIEKGVYETTSYVELFLRNLLFNENNELKNRLLHIDWNKKVDIGSKKVDIGSLKISIKTKNNIILLYQKYSGYEYFGRNDIVKLLKLSQSGASKLINKLLELQIIIPVLKHGKGKYCFNITGV